MAITASGGISLRPAGAEDVDRLVAWHADPEVSRFWDDETFTRAEMEERLARPDVDAWIVEESGDPVGYLQTHPEGLDLFLVPAARGRGIGPEAGRAMARHLLHDRGYPRVTVDPYEWNDAAVRAWERAGFVEISRGHPPDEDHRRVGPHGVPRQSFAANRFVNSVSSPRAPARDDNDSLRRLTATSC